MAVASEVGVRPLTRRFPESSPLEIPANFSIHDTKGSVMRDDDDPEITDDDQGEAEEVSFEDEDPDAGIESDSDDDSNVVELLDEDAAEDTAEIPAVGPPDREVIAGASAVPRWVALGDLVIEYRHWRNPRSLTGLGDDDIAALATDIASKTRDVVLDGTDEVETYAGIDDPLDVVMIAQNGSAVNLVIDGQRRFLAVTKAYSGDPHVMVPVRDREPAPVGWTQAISNRYLSEALTKVGLRSGLGAYELALNAKFLRDQRDEDTSAQYTQERIAQIIGRSESWVSKILKALNNASPKLLHRWEIGEITEEQFRDLAVDKNVKRQDSAAEAVVEARASGGRNAGRVIAKEAKEVVKAKAKAKVERAKAGSPAKKSKEPQQSEIPLPPPRKPPPFAVVEDLLGVSAKKPPTHDYVRGALAGIQWATGLLDAAKMGKPWHDYITRCADGRAKRK